MGKKKKRNENIESEKRAWDTSYAWSQLSKSWQLFSHNEPCSLVACILISVIALLKWSFESTCKVAWKTQKAFSLLSKPLDEGPTYTLSFFLFFTLQRQNEIQQNRFFINCNSTWNVMRFRVRRNYEFHKPGRSLHSIEASIHQKTKNIEKRSKGEF